jgi:hypothetical protein
MKVPNNWHQVTLGQFMELATLPTETDAFDLTNAHIAILCEITQQEVMQLDMVTRDRIRHRLTFIDTEPTGQFSPIFWHNRKRWRVTDRIAKLTAGQYVDICTYLKHGANQNYHRILAVICQPLMLGVFGHKYDTEKSDRYADELLSLPTPVALAIAAFFLNSFEVYVNSIPTYLAEIAEENRTR